MSFNFADGNTRLPADCSVAWLNQRYRRPVAEAHARAALEKWVENYAQDAETDRFLALHAVWFPRKVELTAGESPELDVQFDGPANTRFSAAAGMRLHTVPGEFFPLKDIAAIMVRVYTYFHGRILSPEGAAAEANAHGGRA